MTKADYIASLPLPPYAMSFDGKIFENEISGYRTLMVEGRETLGSEIVALDRLDDGAIYRSKRNEARTLKVKFLIKADTREELRAQLTHLDGLLDIEQAEVIFYDEPDVFYVGTKAAASYDLSGLNAAVGTVEIYCSDPHRYSVKEYELEAEDGRFELFYDGTYKSYPVLEATCASDDGFISYVDDKEHVIQLGDPTEEDEQEEDIQETLINDDFRQDGVAAAWTLNSATLEPSVSSYVQQGTIKVVTNGVRADSYGSNTTTRHGPTITKAVPPDSSSHVGAKNFDLSTFLLFYATDIGQIGEVMIICTGLVDNVKTVICSTHVTKSSTSSYDCRIYYNVMGEQKRAVTVTADKSNKWFGSGGQIRIRKNGSKFTFMANKVTTFEVIVDGTEDYEVTEISLFFNKKKTIADVFGCSVRYAIFTSYSVESWSDVTNKFSDGDVVSCDCGSGRVAVNDEEQYGLGMITNDWEDFYLHNGLNVIECKYSEWADPPTFKLKYRKAYL